MKQRCKAGRAEVSFTQWSAAARPQKRCTGECTEKQKTRYAEHSGFFYFNGAGDMNRTRDLLITNDKIKVFACVCHCL
ncbi:hypothetical protein [Comamonas sp. UBA7528]|uniref:hypothetical protein n=1 Tax=Comamonas sp. UBA7528 TaxID=1946391 RepID=UPI0025BF71B2|nr:hypothetical protein [Comamonas sp. UBA7528]